jgi:sugar lactone lactonase YvrE
LWIDQAQRLHVVDAVAQKVLVYDIAKDPPAFLFSFGEYGAEEGLFNYPNDICIDAGGRLYITDRANNRVQVWSY